MDQHTSTLRLPVMLQLSPRNQPQVTVQHQLSQDSSALLQNRPTTFSYTSTTCTRNQLRTTLYQTRTSRSLPPLTQVRGYSLSLVLTTQHWRRVVLRDLKHLQQAFQVRVQPTS